MNNEVSQKAHEYIKKNRKKLIQVFAGLDKIPPVIKAFSVFMAGSPGAGKTEVSKALLRLFYERQIPCFRIDADEIRTFIPLYTGKNSSQIQKAANKGVNILLDHALKSNQNFILDGTFAYGGIESDISRCIAKKRQITIFYIHQEPISAWKITKARELEEGRNVSKEVFIQCYQNAITNVNLIKEKYPEIRLYVIVRDVERRIKRVEYDAKRIESHVKTIYTIGQLKEMLK